MRKLLTLLLLLLSLLACQSESRGGFKSLSLKTPAGDAVETTLVYTAKDMEQGLSGVKAEDFTDTQGMLFFYLNDDDKNFWMPDTYFDLDLVFLNKDLVITDIIRKLPHYIGRASPDLIPRARSVFARHVLEMKASSPVAAKLKIGDKLEWQSAVSLQDTTLKISSELFAPQ